MGRVKEVKLPYAPVVSVKAPELEATHVPIEEFNKLKLTITEMRVEEERQQATLTRVAWERDDLMQSLKERDEELLKSQEQVEKERKAKFRVKDNLDAANFELSEFNRKLAKAEQQRGQAYADEERAIKAKLDLKTTLNTQIQELKAALRNIESSLARETRLKEKARLARDLDSEELARKIQDLDTARDLVARWEASYGELEVQCEGWQEEARRQNELWVDRGETIFTLEEQNKSLYDNYSGLVEFCRQLMVEVPWRLQSALEDLEEDQVPPAVEYFIYLCRDMVDRFQKEIREFKPRRGQHF